MFQRDLDGHYNADDEYIFMFISDNVSLITIVPCRSYNVDRTTRIVQRQLYTSPGPMSRSRTQKDPSMDSI